MSRGFVGGPLHNGVVELANVPLSEDGERMQWRARRFVKPCGKEMVVAVDHCSCRYLGLALTPTESCAAAVAVGWGSNLQVIIGTWIVNHANQT